MKIDTTQPQIARIYDYMLGGHHNYEADRRAAEELLKLFPAYPKWARLNRWFLQLVARRWAEEGRRHVLDLASGLLTQGHFHDFLPEARMLFCDIDAVSVAYGQQALEGQANARYVQADLRQPEGLLADAATFFGVERELAVGAIGVAYFLSDAELASLMQQLHALCAPGSALALSFVQVPDTPEAEAFLDGLKRGPGVARISFYHRTSEQMSELVKPWTLGTCRNAEDWLEVADMLTATDRSAHIVGAMAEY